MAVLPTDFALPPTLYLLTLIILGGTTAVLLYRFRPPITEQIVVAFGMWMAVGGTWYALYQASAMPPSLAPFASSPAVYVTAGIFAGIIWLATKDFEPNQWVTKSAPGFIGGVGTVVIVLSVGYAVHWATLDEIIIKWSLLALIGSVGVTALGWVVLQRLEYRTAGGVGLLVVFGHVLDGISTAIGYDILGFGEQTPLSRIILEFGATLPTATFIGAAWLFIVVKFVLAVAIVALFDEYVAEAPSEAYLLLAFIAAVGLGPGVHNLVLFAILG